jgi:hypothetical protein
MLEKINWKHYLIKKIGNYDPIAIVRAIMERITWTTITIESWKTRVALVVWTSIITN